MVLLGPLVGLAALLATPALAGSNNHDAFRNKRSHRQPNPAAREVFEGRGTRSDSLALQPRGETFTGRGTYFHVGLGACGQWSNDGDMMVALNSAQYGGGYPGPNCFKSITVQANGVTVGGVTIMDECPTCDWGGLDLSPGLFQHFGDLGLGVLSLTWWFDDDGGSPPPPPPPSSTSEWTPPPSSTTHWWDAQPTSTDEWWTHTSQQQSSSTTTTQSSTSTAAPSSSSTWSSTSSSTSSNSTSMAPSSTSSNAYAIQSGSSGVNVDVGVGLTANSNNLEAFSGLVAAYGQLIVAGAGGGRGTQ